MKSRNNIKAETPLLLTYGALPPMLKTLGGQKTMKKQQKTPESDFTAKLRKV